MLWMTEVQAPTIYWHMNNTEPAEKRNHLTQEILRHPMKMERLEDLGFADDIAVLLTRHSGMQKKISNAKASLSRAFLTINSGRDQTENFSGQRLTSMLINGWSERKSSKINSLIPCNTVTKKNGHWCGMFKNKHLKAAYGNGRKEVTFRWGREYLISREGVSDN